MIGASTNSYKCPCHAFSTLLTKFQTITLKTQFDRDHIFGETEYRKWFQYLNSSSKIHSIACWSKIGLYLWERKWPIWNIASDWQYSCVCGNIHCWENCQICIFIMSQAGQSGGGLSLSKYFVFSLFIEDFNGSFERASLHSHTGRPHYIYQQNLETIDLLWSFLIWDFERNSIFHIQKRRKKSHL